MTSLNCKPWNSLKAFAALAVLSGVAQVCNPPLSAQSKVESPRSSTVLVGNFTLWSSSSQLLSSLASTFGSSFVAAQLSFSSSGMQITGPTQDFQLTGVQSLVPLSPPFAAETSVTATQGTGDPFQVFLVSADLTQYVTVTGNVGPYLGIWANAPNIGALGTSLGEQFSPPISTAFNTPYQIVINVDAQGAATVRVERSGTALGSLSNLQPGTGPFYLVLGQRIGLAPTGTQAADWSYVRVSTP